MHMRTVGVIGLIVSLLAVPAVAQGFNPARDTSSPEGLRYDSTQSDDLSSPALRITYTDFKKLYDAHKVVVIDTRDERSWEMGHIPGSRVIPADDIGKRIRELRKLGKPIVTYCS